MGDPSLSLRNPQDIACVDASGVNDASILWRQSAPALTAPDLASIARMPRAFAHDLDVLLL